MTCEKARRLIEQRLDGTISRPDLAALQEHAATCRACRTALGEVDDLAGVLQEAFASERSPDLAAAHVIAAVRQKPGSAPRRNVGSRHVLLRAFAASAALLVIGIVIGFALDQRPAGPPEIVPPVTDLAPAPLRIEEMAGTVLVKEVRTGEWKEVEWDSRLFPGDRLHCLKDATLRLKLDDGSVVVVEENGLMQLGNEEQGIGFRLEFGTLHAKVAGGYRPFIVRTPDGEVEALGTEFTVTVR